MFDAFSTDELTAIRLSLKVAAVAALASLPLGVLVGWLLARTRFPARRCWMRWFTCRWCCRP